MNVIASPWVIEKIENEHGVSFLEVEEAFFNHGTKYVIDTRESHRTNPPTVWFIGETFEGRLLKVVLIPKAEEGIAILRTAYEPSLEEIEIYEQA